MAKLRYSLFRFRTSAVFTIYEMDERFRGTRGLIRSYKASNGIYIKSSILPELTPTEVCLLGRDENRDNFVSILHFHSVGECDE